MLRTLVLVLGLALSAPTTMRSEPRAAVMPPQAPGAAAAPSNGPVQPGAAKLSIGKAELKPGRFEAEVTVENLTAFRLPAASPPGRAWLHVTVRDRYELPVYESGELLGSGAVKGNDGDIDAAKVEPHYTQIISPDQVQIYESVVALASGALTTGPLSTGRNVKDNRLLPSGFGKTSTDKDVGVFGGAEKDPAFIAGRDTVRYSVPVLDALAPFVITVELWYEPMASRSASGAAVMLVRASASPPQ